MVHLYIKASTTLSFDVEYFGKNKAGAVVKHFTDAINFLTQQQGQLPVDKDSHIYEEEKTYRICIVTYVDDLGVEHQQRFELIGILDATMPLIYYPHSGFYEQRSARQLPINALPVSTGVSRGSDVNGLYYIVDIKALAESYQHARTNTVSRTLTH